MNFNNSKNTLLVVDAEDLRAFANELLQAMELKLSNKKADEETLLSRDQVCKLLGVSQTTLWRWNKEGYLVAKKLGSKTMYRKADVKLIKEGGYHEA